MVTVTAVGAPTRRWRRVRGRVARSLLRRFAALAALMMAIRVVLGVGTAHAAPICDTVGAFVPGAGAACDLAGKAGAAAGSAAVGGTFEKIVDSLLDGYQTMLMWALSWWIKLPTPVFDPSNGVMQQLHDHTVQLQIIGLTISLMFFGLRMMLDRSRSLVDDAEDGFRIVIRAGLSVSAIPLILTVSGQLSDGLSEWLLKEAMGPGNNNDIIKNFLKIDTLGGSGLGTAALGLLGLFGFIGAILQLILLVVREAMLLVVVATLPIAASFSGTGPGSQTYTKLVSWSVAFLLFKPVGALCYFIAFKGAQQKDDPQQVVLGMVLMGLTAFVLPSLLRLITPAVGNMGSGGSGAAAAGATIGAISAGAALAATGGTAGAAGAASSGASGATSIASRSGQSASGSMTSASSNGTGGAPSASTPPSMGPGAQPAMSGGDTGKASSAGGGGNDGGGGGGGGPMKALAGAVGVGSMASSGTSGALSSVGREADVTGPDVSAQPQLQSGYGENEMSR